VNPEQLRYTATHEWVHLSDDPAGGKLATVGLSAFALEALTDLVYIELPEPGRQVSAGEAMAEVESVKAVSEIYSPVDGEIVEINAPIADNLDQLSSDPYGAGWLVKIRVADEAPLAGLLDHAAYQRQCAEQSQS